MAKTNQGKEKNLNSGIAPLFRWQVMRNTRVSSRNCSFVSLGKEDKLRRYLIVGLAKTGTTVISKTIQSSTGIKKYHLEPKCISSFEDLGKSKDDVIVKILFDHWATRPHLLNAIVSNELNTGFTANIFTTRDPRAEIISRLHYVAFPYFSDQSRPENETERWLDLFRRKEMDATFSVREMILEMNRQFGVDVIRGAAEMSGDYARYIDTVPPAQKTIIRYEDFVSSNLDHHPLAKLFSGDRSVGSELMRTRRTGGEDDWKAVVSDDDIDWLNEQVGPVLDALGYPRNMTSGGTINPEYCSLFVERLIQEARAIRSEMNKGRFRIKSILRLVSRARIENADMS